jgi:hypothetical protein
LSFKLLYHCLPVLGRLEGLKPPVLRAQFALNELVLLLTYGYFVDLR